MSERIAVCVGPSPASERLVRAAQRLATSLRAPWHAVHVDVTSAAPLSAEDRERLEAHLALAESLGADVVRLSGRSVADAVLELARERGVTRIVAGKPTHGRWRDLITGSLLDALIRRSGSIEIHVIAPAADLPPKGVAIAPPPRISTFIVGVIVVALATLTYDYFFVAPRFTFAVADVRHLITFVLMFVVWTVMVTLLARLRHAEAASRQRERHTAALLAFTSETAMMTDAESIATALCAHVEDLLHAPASVLLARDGALEAIAGLAPLAPQEVEVARAAYEQRRPTGRGTDLQPTARLVAVPLLAGDEAVGVLAFEIERAKRRVDIDGRRLLEGLARQAALAITRLRLAREAKAEELRSALLSTVSHDLRTPLAVITGMATGLREGTLEPAESLDTIIDEARRLEAIVANLLAITRVESGAQPRTEWVPVEELVGTALARCDAQLGTREVSIDVPASIGVVVDPNLAGQVLVNLLENAAKHTPAGSPIEIRAVREAGGVVIEVSDRGPGLPPGSVFEKFYRGPRSTGAGLGLAVCRAIATVHGGRIEAQPRAGGGVTFRVWLPGGAVELEAAS